MAFTKDTKVYVEGIGKNGDSVAGVITEALPEEGVYRVRLEDGRTVRTDAKNVVTEPGKKTKSAK